MNPFQAGGMKEGDFIVAIDETDVKWSQHDEVVSLIKASGNNLKLKLVTPMSSPSDRKDKVRRPRLRDCVRR